MSKNNKILFGVLSVAAVGGFVFYQKNLATLRSYDPNTATLQWKGKTHILHPDGKTLTDGKGNTFEYKGNYIFLYNNKQIKLGTFFVNPF